MECTSRSTWLTSSTTAWAVRRQRNDILFDVGDWVAGLWRLHRWIVADGAQRDGQRREVERRAATWVSTEQLDASPRAGGFRPRPRHSDAGAPSGEQFRSASAQALPGSGLRLAIVKQVKVLNHGGLLRIEDTDPGGQPWASIYVLLPGRRIPIRNFPVRRLALERTSRGSRGSANVISMESQSTRNQIVQLLLKRYTMPVHA